MAPGYDVTQELLRLYVQSGVYNRVFLLIRNLVVRSQRNKLDSGRPRHDRASYELKKVLWVFGMSRLLK